MFAPLKRSAQSGFTLIELAITIVIVGIFVGSIFILMGARKDIELRDRTNARMEKIMHKLSLYVDSHGRLPCPANPSRTDNQFGWEWNFNFEQIWQEEHFICNNTSGLQTADGNQLNDNNTIGVVPFLSLGLNYEDIKDGWGNYFTYAVSPAFAYDDFAYIDPSSGRLSWRYGLGMRANDEAGVNVGSAGVNINISAQCRTYGWVRMLNDNNKRLTANFGGNSGSRLYGNESYLTNYDWRTTGGATLWALDPRTNPANFNYAQIRRNIGLMKAKFCCSMIPTGTLPSQDAAYPTKLATDGVTPAMNFLGRSSGASDYAPTTDLIIESVNAAGTRVWPTDRPTAAETSYGEAGDSNGAGLIANYPGSNVFANTVANKSIVAPAFVLVSHGANGSGAYLVNGTFDRKGAGVGASEQENADLDRIFVEGEAPDGVGVDTYDDIVMWMTQDNILAFNGSSSCGAP